MPFTKINCPNCNKVAETVSTYKIGDKLVNLLKCGHLLNAEQLNHSSAEQIVSLDNKKLYKFQNVGVKFIEESSARCLISDEMGLGKTVQALAAVYLHKELRPFLVICKASLKDQWQHEIMRWMGEDYFAQIIDSPRQAPLAGMPAFIMSYDVLRRFEVHVKSKSDARANESEEYTPRIPSEEETEGSKLKELIRKMRVKTIILDECQQIKNSEAQRTVHVRSICKEVDHVIALSGTPIKNNAAEYFPVLNILKPEMFPRYSAFLFNYCDSYFNGYSYKTGGLKNPKLFLDKTKSFIIRRTRDEVLPDLPKIRRSFQFHELSKQVEGAYIEIFKQFRDEYNSIEQDELSFQESGNILAYLSRMRHLTGLSKIDPCIDYIMEIMGSTDDRVTVFVHHKDVAEILTSKLNTLFSKLNLPPCARHEAGSSSLDTEKAFEKSRVLIASTLAGGEGLNLQHLCRRFVMLERQWNPANEEQAEARFPRPEGIKTDFIDGVYMVAIGTVDEFFSEIVEQKREIVGKTLDGKASEWNQSSLIKELAERLSMSGGRKWSI
jgi:SWI/SNF-related matrix-associated actin-dependent regulator 1 of chromatin subfamily A